MSLIVIVRVYVLGFVIAMTLGLGTLMAVTW